MGMRFLVTGLDEPGERRRVEGLLRQCGGVVVDSIPPVDVRTHPDIVVGLCASMSSGSSGSKRLLVLRQCSKGFPVQVTLHAPASSHGAWLACVSHLSAASQKVQQAR